VEESKHRAMLVNAFHNGNDRTLLEAVRLYIEETTP
jgi:hypothetical protein